MMRRWNLTLALLILCLCPISIWAQAYMPSRTVIDSDIAGEVLFQNDTIYVLDGFVFVENGEVLTIEPGTIIKGKALPTTGDYASALIVSQGGKVYAMGTQTQPIIFTAESDDVSDPDDLDRFSTGLWGGVILLGYAPYNCGPGEIEGIPTGDPRGAYGGTDKDDNSGVLRYVSIRHGGSELSPANEINGLTMGGVGANTIIDYVEVYANLDDGFEWFGGTVRLKHLVAAFCGDDFFDYDEGFNGAGQYWFNIMAEEYGDNAGEHDGGNNPDDCEPYAIPRFANVTYMGSGEDNTAIADNPRCFHIRDNAGGKWYNSIFTDHSNAGLEVEDLGSGHDSRERWEQGDLEWVNNTWYGFGEGNTWTDICYLSPFIESYMSTNNDLQDPSLGGISRSPDGGLDPRPFNGGSAIAVPDDTLNFFDDVNYRGAFDPNDDLWLLCWTALDHYGFLTGGGCCDTPGDANDDGACNLGDATYVNNFVFRPAECATNPPIGCPPECMPEGDANYDGSVNLGDATYINNFVFKPGECATNPPVGCPPQCGPEK